MSVIGDLTTHDHEHVAVYRNHEEMCSMCYRLPTNIEEASWKKTFETFMALLRDAYGRTWQDSVWCNILIVITTRHQLMLKPARCLHCPSSKC
jgi:hypothetical protein